MSKPITLEFYEVEHEGDLDPIRDDIGLSGGVVRDSSINDEAETATVTIEAESAADFMKKFKTTESFGWLN
jgi:hypothetical protein